MIIQDSDRDTIRRAASSQTAANSQRAAIARALLKADRLLGGEAPPHLPAGDGDVRPQLERLAARIDGLESAMANTDVPDAAKIEEEIGNLRGRLRSLEESLGEPGVVEPKRTSKSRKSG